MDLDISELMLYVERCLWLVSFLYFRDNIFRWRRLVRFSQCTLAWVWLGGNLWFFVLIGGGGFGSAYFRPQIILPLGMALNNSLFSCLNINLI
jgi:hypothetical protein